MSESPFPQDVTEVMRQVAKNRPRWFYERFAKILRDVCAEGTIYYTDWDLAEC